MPNCKSCGDPIVWAKHWQTGKPMPIDDQLSLDGNIVVDLDQEVYWVLSGDRLEQARERGEELAVSHFVTCKYAKRHRRQ